MKKQSISCDECGKQKGDVNHWFMASIKPERVFITPAEDGVYLGGESSDLCGQACVIRTVQKWMDTQSKSQQSAPIWPTTYPAEYSHKPQCAMTCSDGAEKCDCVPGLQIDSKGFTFLHPVSCAANFGGACDC